MPASSPPAAEHPASTTALLARGCIAALVASAPAALRADVAPARAFGAWLVVAALLTPALVVAVLLVGAARRAWSALLGERALAAAVGVALWAALAAPVYARLGSLLQATTHHRALGGATFALAAVAVGLALAAVAARVVASVAARVHAPSARGALAVAVLLALVVSAARFVVLPLLSDPGLDLATRRVVVDLAVALAAVVAVTSGGDRASGARAAGIVATAAGGLVAAGLALLAARADLGVDLRACAPLVAWLAPRLP